MPADTGTSELDRALRDRDELLDRKDRVLASFRRAHEALTDRRRADRGHAPDRRSL